MNVKNEPSTLFKLALQNVSNYLLQIWKDILSKMYCSPNYFRFAYELRHCVDLLIPYTIYDQLFETMVESYVKKVSTSTEPQCVVRLIEIIINPKQRKLKLANLRFIGQVLDEEMTTLEYILLHAFPTLINLTEIDLQTSGTDFTLPTCTNETLNKIGCSCPNLTNLDISYNHKVTNIGLECLLPSEYRQGCPHLVKLFIFECSVTNEGVASFLKSMPKLRFLGYKETGQCMAILIKNNLSVLTNKLELAHLNNLGISSRTCKDFGKLNCTEDLISAIYSQCPKLNGLKVRVTDSNIPLLRKIKTITVLELVYNVGTPASPGNGTLQYLTVSGPQFVSLSFLCDTFTTKYLKVVCEQCCNLKKLLIRCITFVCDQDITKTDNSKCTLNGLEILFFKVGQYQVFTNGLDEVRIPHHIIEYILHKSSVLVEVTLVMCNLLFCDNFIKQLFSSIQSDNIKEIMILIPHRNFIGSSINLTMTSVEILLKLCPQLQKLGNILVWNISLEEYQELRRQLNVVNSALVVLYKRMYI